jgi:hypothetical protein
LLNPPSHPRPEQIPLKKQGHPLDVLVSTGWIKPLS